MSSIKTTERLLMRANLVNLWMGNGSAITPLLDGTFGIGKTTIVDEVATRMGGYSLTVECGSLKEGEYTGLPHLHTNNDGTNEVNFVPYYITASIQRLEKDVYLKAKSEKGLLNGDLKLMDDGSIIYKSKNKKIINIPPKEQEALAISGEINKYLFGENLPTEAKLRLLESGEVKPIIVLFDEMNRTDNQTMKELMNIVLTRIVNGYKYPWWVFMVAAINPCGPDSVYSTNELDPAQLDRFLRIKVSSTVEEWVEWAINKGLNDDYIIALSTSEEIFQQQGKGYEESDSSDMCPSPRSHTICSYIYDTEQEINKTKFFTPEEARESSDDIRQLIIGKIGRRAGNTILAALRNKENYIDPKDILTGKTKVVDEKILNKIMRMKSIARRILMKNIAKYISRTLGAVYYEQHSKNATEAAEAKTKWANITSQIKSLIAKLDSATQLIFAKDSLDMQLDLTDEKYKKYNGKQNLFALIGKTFSLDIIQQVAMTNNAIANGDIDKK